MMVSGAVVSCASWMLEDDLCGGCWQKFVAADFKRVAIQPKTVAIVVVEGVVLLVVEGVGGGKGKRVFVVCCKLFSHCDLCAGLLQSQAHFKTRLHLLGMVLKPDGVFQTCHV